MKHPVNSLCHCGSGLKFKKCCRSKSGTVIGTTPPITTLPFSVRISSGDDERVGVVVSNVSISRGLQRRVLLRNAISVEVNSVDGDKSQKSSAAISIPTDGVTSGTISTYGNASVTGEQSHFKIDLADGKKKLSARSANGLFALAKLALQWNTGQNYFDVIFGVSGKEEAVAENGGKDRPHIAFYPDGNGKFVRLSGYDCEIESTMRFEPSSGQVEPNIGRIKLLNHDEVLILNFTVSCRVPEGCGVI